MVVAVAYGLSFDLLYEVQRAAQQECWQLQRQLVLSSELSEIDVAAAQAELVRPKYADSFSGETSDSASWLLSLVQSLLLSLLVWQPLTVYVVTWMKVWLFTWNLKMGLAPGNLAKWEKSLETSFK